MKSGRGLASRKCDGVSFTVFPGRDEVASLESTTMIGIMESAPGAFAPSRNDAR